MKDPFLQSLDVRASYAIAEIMDDESTQFEAEIEAHILGVDAQRAGQSSVPALFETVPALNKAWHEGWNAAANGRAHWSRWTEEDAAAARAYLG